ncbi:MAG TPA: alpha/beta hydrolase, partial [Candidatus Udaeobacter sp.]|nr:alpha/beta hydrolase [Candidatus Udaeobacter sp.]
MIGRPGPAEVAAVRGELARVAWGDEERVPGSQAGTEATILPFRAESTRGVDAQGLCKFQPLGAGGTGQAGAAIEHLFLMLAGQGTGARAVRLLNLPPGHAVVALDYPYRGSRDLGRWDRALANVPAMAAAARMTAASLSLAGLALRSHPALAHTDVTLVGASFGGPFSILAAAAERERYRGLALLYAFARLDLVLGQLLARARWAPPARAFAHWLLARQVRPYEPVDHLPRLAGMPLLILNDMEDAIVPRASIEALHAAAPSGARIELIAGGHVRPDADQLIAELVARVIAWSGTLSG